MHNIHYLQCSWFEKCVFETAYQLVKTKDWMTSIWKNICSQSFVFSPRCYPRSKKLHTTDCFFMRTPIKIIFNKHNVQQYVANFQCAIIRKYSYTMHIALVTFFVPPQAICHDQQVDLPTSAEDFYLKLQIAIIVNWNIIGIKPHEFPEHTHF